MCRFIGQIIKGPLVWFSISPVTICVYWDVFLKHSVTLSSYLSHSTHPAGPLRDVSEWWVNAALGAAWVEPAWHQVCQYMRVALCQHRHFISVHSLYSLEGGGPDGCFIRTTWTRCHIYQVLYGTRCGLEDSCPLGNCFCQIRMIFKGNERGFVKAQTVIGP